MHMRYFLVLAVCLLLTGCGSKTTVILLPEDDGKTGAVQIETEKDSQTIDTPYTFSTVSSIGETPTQPQEISKDQVDKDYKDVLAAHPLKPVSFILYFHTGSTRLTKQSKAIIPQVLAVANVRTPSEISVIGHTDSTGSKEFNMKLSLKRAKVVESLIRSSEIVLQKIYIQSFGESDPLVPTPDNVPEPKNRRVEVMIR